MGRSLWLTWAGRPQGLPLRQGNVKVVGAPLVGALGQTEAVPAKRYSQRVLVLPERSPVGAHGCAPLRQQT